MSSPTPDAHLGAVTPAEVVAALGRLLESEQFTRSERSRDFLAYVVTETLAGRGERLSERTVARWALGRDAAFDGRGDASVRVRGSRVRRCLAEYYASTGAGETIRVAIPRGGYVPVFERRPAPPARHVTVPGVAVVALGSDGDEPAALVARSLSEELVQQLAHHRDVRVVGPTSAGPAPGEAPAGDVSSVLTGHVVVREGRLRLLARLVDAQTGEVLWTTDELVELADLGTFDTEARWAREIASELGDATGLVVRQEMRRSHGPGTEPELAARLAFYSYVDRGTATSITEAVTVVDAALATGHRTATLLAMRAALANAAVAYGLGDRADELERAESFAREALTLDGDNAHAHLVLGSVARDRGHWQVAIGHADRAVELAPYRPSYLIGAGITLSGAGEWRRGSDVIREAHRLHPGLSGHTHAWLAMGHLVEADYARALAEAGLLPAEDGYVWGPLYRAMALSGLGHHDEARAEAAKVRAMRPDVMDDVGGYFGSRMRLTAEQRSRLAALL